MTRTRLHYKETILWLAIERNRDKRRSPPGPPRHVFQSKDFVSITSTSPDSNCQGPIEMCRPCHQPESVWSEHCRLPYGLTSDQTFTNRPATFRLIRTSEFPFALSYLRTKTIPTYASQHILFLRHLCDPTKWK